MKNLASVALLLLVSACGSSEQSKIEQEATDLAIEQINAIEEQSNDLENEIEAVEEEVNDLNAELDQILKDI